MDSDELDQWLEGDDLTTPDAWSDSAQSGGSRGGAQRTRISWKLVATVGAFAWLLVMGVVFVGGGSGADTQVVASEDDDQLVVADQEVMAPVTLDPTDPMPMMSEQDVAQPVAEVPAEQTEPPGIIAGAVAALRQRLTFAGEASSYLEWATPVATEPLGAGMWLVVLDAIWLEGPAGELSAVQRARWSVPVSDEGREVSPPWLLGPVADGSQETDLVPPPPPSGTERLAEVQQAVTRAGWTQANAVASDPHPLLEGVVVALIEGIAPGRDQLSTEVVWLREGADGVLDVAGALS